MTDIIAYRVDPEFVLLGDDGEPLESPGLTDDEAFAFLAGSSTGEHNVPLTAAAEVHTGAMIALIPTVNDAERLAVDLGEPADQLHVTFMYLGNAADWSPSAQVALEEALRPFARELAPVDAEGFAISIFNPPGSERDDGVQRDACVVLQLSGSALAVVHNVMTALVGDAYHDPEYEDVSLPQLPQQHSPWIPHMTLEYTDDVGQVAELVDRVGPVRFDVLRLAFGGKNTDIPLVGTLVASAVEAAFWNKNKHPRNPADGEFVGVGGGIKNLSEGELAREWQSHTDSLSDAQWRSVHDYTKSDYQLVNGVLRGAIPLTDGEGGVNREYTRGRQLADDLRSTMTPAPVGVRVRREADLTDLGLKGGFQYEVPSSAVEALVGKTITNDGFTSATASAKALKGKRAARVHLEIDVPRGTPSLWVGKKSAFPDEQELLLDAGLKFKVVDVKVDSKRKPPEYHVKLKVV